MLLYDTNLSQSDNNHLEVI